MTGRAGRVWAYLHDDVLRAKRRFLLLGLDAVIAALSLYAAYMLRFDGRVPADYWAQFLSFLPLLVVMRVAMTWLFGVHHWSFRLAGLPEGVRLILAGLAGSGCFVLVPYFFGLVGVPRSVVALEFFTSTSLAAALRFSSRLTQPWLLDHVRSRSSEGLLRTLIVGAGSSGDLLLRDLKRSPNHPYEVVGFVDDDPSKWRAYIGGRPVLGGLRELPELARRLEIRQLLFAIPELTASRIREILAGCADLKLKYKILPVSFAYLNDRVNATMLHDLAPEDLLAREQAEFDPRSCVAMVEGRCVLVTGAAGSIGSEICRQLAASGPRSSSSSTSTRTTCTSCSASSRRGIRASCCARRWPTSATRERLFQLGRRVPTRLRLPRGGPQARAAHGVRPGRGDQEQRDRLPQRRRHGGRRAACRASC